ncbi:hypothetical protein BUALT_Bualt13G0077300 [Buddleja alternifolia]|uniref:glutaminase n=1 Tax=Buddleja alternifolia TaxID=168488 RepID=A0AAV6WLC4_9LAMI|nr:hypothetical protein BUALT_Bualt13G0077300 [Buddleja alternifolia]
MAVGVLALQGSFNERLSGSSATLKRVGVKGVEIRKPEQLQTVNALIIPGGESTTMAKLAHYHNLFPALREFVKMGNPVCGTCAGLIFLADKAAGQKAGSQELIGGLDCTVHRNLFGSPLQSFEADLSVPEIVRKEGGPPSFRGVFIRAPAILEVGPAVQVLADFPAPSDKTAKSDSAAESGETSGTKAKKWNAKKWKKGKNNGATVATKIQKKVKSAKGNCFHCKEDGHWKRNCPKYLASLPAKSGKAPNQATAFHPELTAYTRWHSYFLKMVNETSEEASTSTSLSSDEQTTPKYDLPVFQG